MNTVGSIRRALYILAAVSLAASGVAHGAHAGGGAQPHIEATLIAHDVSHCTKHGSVVSCYTTTETSIGVSGTGFTPGGSVRIEVQDAQTLAIYDDQVVQAGVQGHAGTFSVDTGHRYCTQHGRTVRAYDLTTHSAANVVSIQPCGTL